MLDFNPVIILARNNLHLTKKAIQTIKNQDIYGGVYTLCINNASTDGTSQYLQTEKNIAQMYFDPPMSVAASWNRGLEYVFKAGADYCLVVNNDIELRPDTYRLLVEDGGAFVTAVGNNDPESIKEITQPDQTKKRPHPDFSCYLIRKATYEQVGPFDERFLIAFCEDWDYHCRLHRSGITAYCIDLPFLHHGSMTVKMAELSEVRKIQAQAERNREYFKEKWGFAGASKEYEEFFKTSPSEHGHQSSRSESGHQGR